MEDKRITKLLRNLDKAVEKICDKPITVAFSGGIDSTLVAFLSKKYCEVELIAVGIPNSHDIRAAKSAAKLINTNLKIIEIEQTEMVSEALDMQKQLDLSGIEVEFMLPFWIVAKNASNPILMCGQGADELFGGYARFRKEGAKKNLKKEVKDLIMRIPAREEKIANIFNLKLSCPYLSKNVIDAAEDFSVDEHIGKIGKIILRKVATEFGLPKEITNRKKKAAQYGSGSQKAIKNIIKHKIQFEIEFENEKLAKAIAKATEPENAGWVDTAVNGRQVKAVVKAKNLGSLKEAAEDFMACIAVAEKVSK
tara:strand:+ start:120 stop:1046 length:927 start_codon:yes stop_codon:yes gene_type:complete